MRNNPQHKKPGRPLAYATQQDAPMTTYSVRLTAWHARHARHVGGGSLAEGVRLLIEEYERRKSGA